jgi:putative oxidoreductase
MSYGILFLRFVLGLTVAAHGAQKLFGSFGGHGPRGTGGFFGTIGFRAPLLLALAAGTAEFGGGVLLASGLLTPLAVLAIAVVMLNAIGSVQWRNGFWNSKGGYEFNLNLWAVVVAIAAIGPGRFSLDAHRLGRQHQRALVGCRRRRSQRARLGGHVDARPPARGNPGNRAAGRSGGRWPPEGGLVVHGDPELSLGWRPVALGWPRIRHGHARALVRHARPAHHSAVSFLRTIRQPARTMRLLGLRQRLLARRPSPGADPWSRDMLRPSSCARTPSATWPTSRSKSWPA